MTGTVFDVKEFAVYDGPGVRTTVFLKGCPLRCMWCHNPEGLSPAPQLMVSPSACAHCGACRAVCEHPGHCVACGKCIPVCPLNLRRIAGKKTDSAELAELVRQVQSGAIRYCPHGSHLLGRRAADAVGVRARGHFADARRAHGDRDQRLRLRPGFRGRDAFP